MMPHVLQNNSIEVGRAPQFTKGPAPQHCSTASTPRGTHMTSCAETSFCCCRCRRRCRCLCPQGENNMHAMFGNSQLGTGYACLMAKLVSDWRALWAKSSGTDPMAPFGLVTLAASGGEGGADIGSMRLAQTASYGVLPNPLMPNTFLAQAGDLDDPVGNLNCYHAGCCQNMSASPMCKQGVGCQAICHGGSTPDYSWEDTPVYMGPIHPRDKKPVGLRLARAAAATAYSKPGAATGPTITGCTLSADKRSIVVKFNASLFGGDTLAVGDYSKTNTSQMSVLVNQGKFCLQSASSGKGKPSYCLDDGFGHFNSTGQQITQHNTAPLFQNGAQNRDLRYALRPSTFRYWVPNTSWPVNLTFFDLNRAPYVLYGITYIDLVSLDVDLQVLGVSARIKLIHSHLACRKWMALLLF